ncbi:MAG: pyruvate formate lyase family protein [Anaerolineales bacterium]
MASVREQVKISPTYAERIAALRETKNIHTDIKVKRFGHFDTDDHGYIPWDEPIAFEPYSDHPSGGVWGPKAIGISFRRWLNAHPVYVHPMCSVAGCWVYKGIPGVAGWTLDSMFADSKPKPSDPKPTDQERYFRTWRPEDRPMELVPLMRKYNIVSPGVAAANHIGPDMQIGLDLGFGGILANIRRYRELNRPPDTSFYDGEEQLVLGIQEWIAKHVTLAREMAAEEESEGLRDNLLAIADASEWVIENPPRTFREACQFLAYAQDVDRMWALGGALGQLDELLRPYYERDLAAGIETDESVVWHLCSLFFNDPHYSQIGGQAADGHDLTSPMSFRVLDAMHALHIPTNIALRVWDGMDRSLLRRALEYMIEDGTGVSFSLSGGLDSGFVRLGHTEGLARMRAKVGCNWTALPGVEYCLQDVTRVDLVQPMLLAIDEVLQSEAEPTMDALWAAYERNMAEVVNIVKRGKDIHMERQARNYPEIVLNLFCHGPIERGVDCSAGGVDIVDLAMDAIGLATTADSFAAIEQRIFREKRLSFAEFVAIMHNNYADNERVRYMMNSIKRYGSGNARADEWAVRIANLWTHLVADTPTPHGYRTVPGLFSHGATNTYGEHLPATPNGRRAGEPISHSADPDPGFVPGSGNAATAKANAVASVQSGYGNSTPLQIELDDTLVHSHGGLELLESLILTHNKQGGTLINMNVVSKKDVMEAHADPMTHPDLMIRVTGYSAYFRTLSKEYRQPIVDRILSEG